MFWTSTLGLNSCDSGWMQLFFPKERSCIGAFWSEKLSTKNPDLNLFNPLESWIKRFEVFVSNRERLV